MQKPMANVNIATKIPGKVNPATPILKRMAIGDPITRPKIALYVKTGFLAKSHSIALATTPIPTKMPIPNGMNIPIP